MKNNIETIALRNIISLKNKPVPFYEGTKKYYSTGDFGTDNYELVTFENKPSRANLLFEEGQITLAKMRGTNKIKIVSKEMEDNIYSTGFFAIEAKNIDRTYLYYLLQSTSFNQEKDSLSYGTTQFSINEDRLKNIKLQILSDINHQKKISDFLDYKVDKIDKILCYENEQINYLKEYKKNLIYSVVVEGVVKKSNSNIKHKYLLGLNENFEIKPISSLFEIVKRIIGKEPKCVLSITQNGIVPKDIESNNGQLAESYDKYQIVEVGDFAMNHMDLLTGWVDISKYEGVTSPDYRVFRLKEKKYNKKYFLYVFQSYYAFKVFYGFGQGVSNLGRWRLQASNFNKIMIPVPSKEDQDLIVKYLDEKTQLIDELIDIKSKKIEVLEEYKQSLIYEYVTGKKEVIA